MIWEHYRKQPGGDRDFIKLLTLYQRHGQDAVGMACELAVEYGTMQLPAVIALLHDLTEPESAEEMTVEAVRHFARSPPAHPQLQRPPKANCQRYDQLLSKGEAA